MLTVETVVLCYVVFVFAVVLCLWCWNCHRTHLRNTSLSASYQLYRQIYLLLLLQQGAVPPPALGKVLFSLCWAKPSWNNRDAWGGRKLLTPVRLMKTACWVAKSYSWLPEPCIEPCGPVNGGQEDVVGAIIPTIWIMHLKIIVPVAAVIVVESTDTAGAHTPGGLQWRSRVEAAELRDLTHCLLTCTIYLFWQLHFWGLNWPAELWESQECWGTSGAVQLLNSTHPNSDCQVDIGWPHWCHSNQFHGCVPVCPDWFLMSLQGTEQMEEGCHPCDYAQSPIE